MPDATTDGPSVALCAVQLTLSLDDFRGERQFRAAIERAVESALPALEAADHGLLVFPENTGHFIPLMFAPALARRQSTVTRAMAVLAAHRPLRLARTMWGARLLDVQKALMLDAMPAADALMRSLFADIARRTGAYVVAGSHLRPHARAVSNTSYTFGPDGALLAATDKINLVPGMEDHRPGGVDLARGHHDRLPVVPTPFGNLATLICYDGFAVPHTLDEPEFKPLGERVDALEVDIIANPAANPWPWFGPWVHAQPDGPQTRDRQWQTEGLPATLAGLGHARYGLTAQLCARILDFSFEGPSEVLARQEDGTVAVLARADSHDGPAVVSARVTLPA